MKYYGIDCQGYFKVQKTTGVADGDSIVTGEERRLVYVDTGTEDHLLFAGDRDNKWIRIVLNDDSLYSNISAQFNSIYHPLGGSTTESITASSYSGDGTGNFRITDTWIKLADNIGASGSVGIKIEAGSTSSDSDDITLSFVYGAAPDGVYPTKWQFNNGGYTNDPIATHSWVSGKITSTVSAGTYTKVEVDERFVRYVDTGDFPQNTTWQEWLALTNDNIGNSTPVNDTTACRHVYRKNEIYGGFVRSGSTATENSPLASGSRPIYSTSSNISSTVVERNSAGDIFCNILHGTATAAQYADLAENYTCDEGLLVGTVVEVSDNTDYEVSPCMFSLSPSVVGVISANPAYLMNTYSEGLPIALTGKVPVRVIGPVHKGDFLVSAGGGLARKGLPEEISFKIGIVLKTDLQSNEKLVECIIK